MDLKGNDKRLVEVVPSEKQIEWQQMELIVFIHYGTNAFLDREWGDGTAPVSTFDPKALSTDDWCESLVDAGAKGVILTAKHHDGFCLWPSKYTDYCVKNAPCKTDVVESMAKSCKKYGLKLGIYLSPWDRHEATYGSGAEYDNYFCNQLEELLSNYGDIFEVWFDGACGEGPNGKKQYYNWKRYYEVIRKLQPNAVTAICGEDIRWCGNEAGECRESEWSVVPDSIRDNEKVAEESQQEDDDAFREAGISSMDKDLGSREVVKHVKDLVWFPAEVDTSIRPGWFHHDAEDDKVKSLDQLVHIYMSSVGGNASLLLNVPPHRDGYLTKSDKVRLKELGDFVRNAFSNNLGEDATVVASTAAAAHEASSVLLNDETYWEGTEGETEWSVTLTLPKAQTITYLTLMEQIRRSQRIEMFTVYAVDEAGTSVEVATGTTVGYKKICRFEEPVTSKEFKIVIKDARVAPTLKFIGLY